MASEINNQNFLHNNLQKSEIYYFVCEMKKTLMNQRAFPILINNSWKWSEIWNLGNSLYSHKFWHKFYKSFQHKTFIAWLLLFPLKLSKVSNFEIQRDKWPEADHQVCCSIFSIKERASYWINPPAQQKHSEMAIV